MDKTQLRDALMAQLWRMYKMDIMLYLREFLVGETALLEYICDKKDAVTPSAISEDMRLSRARTANILRTLREKGYVEMEVDSADRRRMNVTATPAGENYLKGKHAYIVCTHVDRKHIHSHIIFNSTTLDGTAKFRDFLGSGRALGLLSDLICLEHNLSVIANPRRYTHPTYDKWLGDKKQPSHRDVLRAAIDDALAREPKTLDDLLQLVGESGSRITFEPAISLVKGGDGVPMFNYANPEERLGWTASVKPEQPVEDKQTDVSADENWKTLNITCQGSKITYYIDGQQIGSCTLDEPAYPEYMSVSMQNFDRSDVSIWDDCCLYDGAYKEA